LTVDLQPLIDAIQTSLAAADRQNRYLTHINSESPLEIVLKGHLWVEGELTDSIRYFLPAPQHMDIDRLTFSHKIALAAACAAVPPEAVKSLSVLNKLRNELAHKRDHQVTHEDARRLIACLDPGYEGLADSDFPDNLRRAITVVLMQVAVFRRMIQEEDMLHDYLLAVRAGG
jgi:hypothetical protein